MTEIKEVRKTVFRGTDGMTRTATTYRCGGFFSGEYQTTVSVPPRGQMRSSFEIGASGGYRSAKDAERTAINKVRQREERLSRWQSARNPR